MNDDTLAHLIAADALLDRAFQEAVDERQRKEDEAAALLAAEEAQREAARQARVRRHIDFDQTMLVCVFWFVVTFVGPGLIGYFVLRHTFLLPTDPEATGDSRNWGWYLLWCAVAGQAVTMLITGGILLRKPWPGRERYLALGAALVIVSLVLLPFARSKFQYQEVMSTAFPFAKDYYTCGDSVKIPVQPDGEDKPQLWQMYRAQPKGTKGSACNRVVLYRGGDEISQADSAAREYFLPDTAPDGGAAMFASNSQVPIANSDVVKAELSDITFYARTNTGRVVSVNLAEPTTWH